MKVIMKKEAYGDWKLTTDCNGKGWSNQNKPCKSILEINEEDIVKRDWYKYPDMSGVSFGFVCPICGCFTEVDNSHIDENVKKHAKCYK